MSPSEPTAASDGAAPADRAGWDRLLLPGLTLSLAGISLVVLVRMLALPNVTRDGFLSSNILTPALRKSFLVSVLLGAVLPLVAAAGMLFKRGPRGVAAIEKAGAYFAPLSLACLLPALFSVQFSHANQLLYLLVLGAFGLLGNALLRRTMVTLGDAPGPRLGEAIISQLRGRARLTALRRPSPRVFFFVLVVIASAAYAAYFGYYTIRNHHRLVTTAFDLGICDNLMFNAMHGHPFRAPVLMPAGGNGLASHALFGVFWLAPFYALYPDAHTLLIVEALLIGFSAVPLYLFASTQLSRPMSAAIAIASLWFPPTQGPNFYDFQWSTLTPFFIYWLAYAIAMRRQWLTVVMTLILFSIREDIAVDLVGMGLFLLLTRIRPRAGLILAVVSGIWFGIDRFVIMPLAGSWYFPNLYAGLFSDGESSFGSVIKTILTNPLFFVTSLMTEGKLIYVLHMVVPVVFLPLRRLSFLLLLLPAVFFTIMTTGAQPMTMISFHYTNHWVPFVWLASILAMVVIGREHNGRPAQLAALCTLGIVMLADTYCFGAVLQHENFVGGFGRIEFKITAAEQRRYADLKELVAMIPPKASVAATENEVPHISARMDAMALRVTPPHPVDYLLIGRSHVGNLSQAALNGALANPNEYGLLAQRGEELFLFKRGYVSAETARARALLGVP